MRDQVSPFIDASRDPLIRSWISAEKTEGRVHSFRPIRGFWLPVLGAKLSLERGDVMCRGTWIPASVDTCHWILDTVNEILLVVGRRPHRIQNKLFAKIYSSIFFLWVEKITILITVETRDATLERLLVGSSEYLNGWGRPSPLINDVERQRLRPMPCRKATDEPYLWRLANYLTAKKRNPGGSL